MAVGQFLFVERLAAFPPCRHSVPSVKRLGGRVFVCTLLQIHHVPAVGRGETGGESARALIVRR